MLSKYHDQIDFDCPMSEYPRPQMVRDSYLCLNGPWNYNITGQHRTCSGQVVVPFSLECEDDGKDEQTGHAGYQQHFKMCEIGQSDLECCRNGRPTEDSCKS